MVSQCAESRASIALKAAPVKAFYGCDYGVDESNARITKAHARGTSISPVLPMRC